MAGLISCARAMPVAVAHMPKFRIQNFGSKFAKSEPQFFAQVREIPNLRLLNFTSKLLLILPIVALILDNILPRKSLI